MPQHDTDHSILLERAYGFATTEILVEGIYENWSSLTRKELVSYRESLRSELLREFPDLEGDEIAEEMDAALHDHHFPFDRA